MKRDGVLGHGPSYHSCLSPPHPLAENRSGIAEHTFALHRLGQNRLIQQAGLSFLSN